MEFLARLTESALLWPIVAVVALGGIVWLFRHVPKALAVLMVTAFIDMVGLLMVIPLLPFYATRLGGGGLMVGLLVSSFSIAQLISAPAWGRVSDKYGRRPALMIGLGASGIAYLVFAFADSLFLLFLSRIVQGAGGGTVGVVQAYVADSTAPENRAKSLGWLSAATNLGVAIGPVLGSLALGLGARRLEVGGASFALGYAAPGLFAAVLCAVNMFFAWRYLVESHEESARGKAHAKGRGREAIWRVVSHSAEPSSRLIWIYAIAMGAFHGVNAILALFLAVSFGVDERTIGFVFMYIGTISVVTRAGVLGWALDWLGEARLSRIGAVLLAAGLASIPLATGFVSLALGIALIPLGTAFTFPCVTALLSRVIGNHERGLYMGVQQTFGGLARVVAPILAGYAYDHGGRSLPFFVGAVAVLGTLLLGSDLERYMQAKPEAAPA